MDYHKVTEVLWNYQQNPLWPRKRPTILCPIFNEVILSTLTWWKFSLEMDLHLKPGHHNMIFRLGPTWNSETNAIITVCYNIICLFVSKQSGNLASPITSFSSTGLKKKKNIIMAKNHMANITGFDHRLLFPSSFKMPIPTATVTAEETWTIPKGRTTVGISYCQGRGDR